MGTSKRTPILLAPTAEPVAVALAEAPASPLPDDAPPDAVDASSVDADARWVRPAALALGAYLVFAFFYVLFHVGAQQWFAGDEWGFLADRQLTVDDLFRPLQTHLSTVPIVAYHGLYEVFGLESYKPYMASVLLLHLGLCVLLWIVMRRAGVHPWVATVAVGSFVLYGPGEENIVLGVQVSMVGSMVLGFGHLLLADHDGKIDRRDGLGLVCGALGLMCSGIGPVLVVVVGFATFIRRGWRAAAFHTAPLAALYLGWYAVYRDNMDRANAPSPTVDTMLDWVYHGETGVFTALGGFGFVGLALGIATVVGVALAWGRLPFADLRRRASMPTALLIGAGVLLLAVSSQRWILGVQFARSSRYLAMATAFTLPVIAVGLDALIRRWRYAAVPVLVLLLAGIPGNIGDFGDRNFVPGWFASQRRIMVAAANAPYADEVPRDLEPESNPFGGQDVTMGFLLDAKADGALPEPPPWTPSIDHEMRVRLGLDQRVGDIGDLTCETYEEPVDVTAQPGDRFGFLGRIMVSPQVEGLPLVFPISYDSTFEGEELVVVLPDQGTDLRLRFLPPPDLTGYTLCR